METLNIDGKEIEIEGLEREMEHGAAVLFMPAWEEMSEREPAPEVSICITPKMKATGSNMREMKAYWGGKAKAFVDLLCATMPQGLLDHILAELSFRQARVFTVRSEFWEDLIQGMEGDKR